MLPDCMMPDGGDPCRAYHELWKALADLVYEVTHLSPEQDDGSHWCKISKEALSQARRVLSS